MAQQTAETKREKVPMNGVDTPTLFATINAVKDQPELAKFQFRASSRWMEGTHSRSQVEAFTGGGRWLHWGRGGELFYWSSFTRQMRRVAHRIEGGRFAVTAQELAWAGADEPVDVPLSEFLGRGFDLDPQALRFLMLVPASAHEPPPPRIVFAQGWVQQLLTRGASR